MRKFIHILFLAFMTGWASAVAGDVPVIPAELTDAPLDSVVVTGVDSALAAEIGAVLLSRQSGILNSGLVEHDIATTVTLLRERGWWRAQISAAIDSTDGIVLRFFAEPGPPAFIGRISLTGDSAAALTEPSAANRGTLFSRAFMDSLMGEITVIAANAGYPGTLVAPALSARGDTIAVTLPINPGARARIDSIAVRGLTRTREYVVRRALAALAGLPAGPPAGLDAAAALRHIEYLRMDGSPVIEYDAAGNGLLIVPVSEPRQGAFDGVLGYPPGSDGASGDLVGRFHLDMENMFGTGRAALVRWENLGSNSEDMEVRYTEPWVFGRPWDVSGSFLQEERNIQGYTRTGMSLTVGRRIGDLRGELGARYEKISADSLHSSAATGVEAALVWSVLDDRENPSSGFSYSVSWSSLSRTWRFTSRPRTRIDHVAIDLDQYIPTFAGQTLALGVRYRNVIMPIERMAPADRYWLGGASTIRGYAERLLPAVKASWTTIEYRFLAGEASRVFLFTDIGYLIDRRVAGDAVEKHTRTVAGYGFGLRLRSGAGTLGFDYGLSRGDTIAGGKVHVSLSTDF